ncbi:hypothetical protein I4F81_003565 [Pyropia yezoensis]|uniref:Uncharacterized protein n=1 Tax=Pyropia yezoensis TaxID=2788 RepID=A0ACC3BTD8_PYRYE|nr:hypothetical protein I4F81_003565 [Neopyropia yezoensis]
MNPSTSFLVAPWNHSVAMRGSPAGMMTVMCALAGVVPNAVADTGLAAGPRARASAPLSPGPDMAARRIVLGARSFDTNADDSQRTVDRNPSPEMTASSIRL